MSSSTFLLGSAMLVIWCSLDLKSKEGVDEDVVNDWWTNEHLPERLSIPGFLRARRFYTKDPDSDTSQYLVCYEVESLDTLISPAYMSALNNPTAATAKFMPAMATINRCACRVLHSAVRADFTKQSSGLGGTIAHIAFTPPSDLQQRESIRSLIVNYDAPYMFNNAAILAAHLLELDDTATQSGSSSKSYDAASFQGQSEVSSAKGDTKPGLWIILAEFAEPLQAPFAKGPAVTRQTVLQLQANGAKDIAWRIYGMICAVAA